MYVWKKEARVFKLFVSICIKFKTKHHEVTDYLGDIYMDGSSEEEKEDNYNTNFIMGVSSGWMEGNEGDMSVEENRRDLKDVVL